MYQANHFEVLLMCLGGIVLLFGIAALIFLIWHLFADVIPEMKRDYKGFKEFTGNRFRYLEEEICKLKKENDNASCKSGKSQESNS